MVSGGISEGSAICYIPGISGFTLPIRAFAVQKPSCFYRTILHLCILNSYTAVYVEYRRVLFRALLTWDFKLIKLMDSTRQNRVARLLQKELGQIFQRLGHELGGKLYTVTVVRISPDLSVARVYLSIFPVVKDEDPLELVKDHTTHIRYELGLRVRHQLRIIPELTFFLDDSLDYIDKIDHLLKP